MRQLFLLALASVLVLAFLRADGARVESRGGPLGVWEPPVTPSKSMTRFDGLHNPIITTPPPDPNVKKYIQELFSIAKTQPMSAKDPDEAEKALDAVAKHDVQLMGADDCSLVADPCDRDAMERMRSVEALLNP